MARVAEKIARFRQRDVLMVLPMTLVAALGGGVWLAPAVVAGWLALSLSLIAASQLYCRWILREADRPSSGELPLAIFTFFYTCAYAILPLAMIVHGGEGATIAGAAMIGAMALSGAGEFVVSKTVGGASFAAIVVAAGVGLGAVWWWAAMSPLELTVAAIASASFFAYAFQHALHRAKTEFELASTVESARQSEGEAQSANAAKSTFLATMSHEIRTPLNGVLGMAQAMGAEPLSDTQRGRLNVITESGEALLQILSDVLDLAKIEAGKLECENIPFDIDDVAGGARVAFSMLAQGKSLSFDVMVEPAARGIYRGDPTRLRQILNNLISNALKFTETGGIRLSIDRHPEGLRLVVSDTGAGMPADRLHKLFGKFSQLDASTTRQHGGTGLGLAICRELCELMNGSISAESVLGEGSTFTVILRLERIGDAAERPPGAPAAPRPPAATRLRILAAEDNAVNRLVLKTFLAQIDIEPTMVEDGAQALQAWRDGDWDLILMDVQMPVMDGVAATRAIRTIEHQTGRRRTPIVALTANAMSHQLAEYHAAEMDACVSKPLRVAELFETLERVLAADEDSARAAVA